MNWLLTHTPTTFLTIVIVGVAAALAGWSIGWSIGFNLGRDAARLPARPLPTVQTVTGGSAAAASLWHYVTDTPGAACVRGGHAVDRDLAIETAAFDRGVEAGERRERDRARQVRSAAGVRASATRKNRITGEVRTALDVPIGSVVGVTGTTATNADSAATLTADAGEGDE